MTAMSHCLIINKKEVFNWCYSVCIFIPSAIRSGVKTEYKKHDFQAHSVLSNNNGS